MLIIYTGGTVGMVPDEKGSLKPVKKFLVEKIKELEELKKPGMPSCKVGSNGSMIFLSSIRP